VDSHHPDDGDAVVLRNVGFYNSSDVAICPRRFYLFPLPQKLQDILHAFNVYGSLHHNNILVCNSN
jgi:hypothetical protein